MSFFQKTRDRKFGNALGAACSISGHSHGSKLEASVCGLISLRERAGELRLLQIQAHQVICGPPGHVCPKNGRVEYVPDFRCQVIYSGKELFIEAKGFEDQKWPRTKRLWRHYGPADLEIWVGDFRNPRLDEIIQGGCA